MKKFTFIFAFVALAFGFSYSQATMIVTSPTNNATSAFRLPNGTSAYAYFRGASLVMPSELTTIPVSTTLTSVGFTTTAGASSASTGTITIYLQNTGDVTFNKGGVWTGITPGMTSVYTGTMTIPASATSFDLPLTTSFVFLGSGMYIAYDYVSAGPFAVTSCTWASNNTLNSGCVAASNAAASPTTCFASNWRPCVRFGYVNTLTNDVSVEKIIGLGDIPAYLGGPFSYDAIVKNNSIGPLSNVNVTMNINGANTYSVMGTISSIAAGATGTVSLGGWSPLVMGVNTVNVSVPSDQNNANNSKTFMNTVSCNTGGIAENPATLNNSVGFGLSSGILTCQMQIPVTTTVTGAELGISSNTTSVGNNIYAAILDNTGLILATSNTLNIASGDLNSIKSFTFASPVSLAAGQIWHIGMAQTVGTFSYYPIAAYSTPAIPGNIIYNTASLTGGTLTPLTINLGVFHLSADFAGSCAALDVNSVSASDNSLSVYPNPASSSVFVKLGSISGKATAIVYNTIGQVVVEAKEFNADLAEINVNSLPKGVYILKITNGKEVSNTKIVVER